MLNYIKLTLLTHLQDDISSDHKDRDRQTDRQISVHTHRVQKVNGYELVP